MAKNISLLIDAVARLDLSVRLVLIGSGPDEDRLRAYIRKRGLSSRIVLLVRSPNGSLVLCTGQSLCPTDKD